MFEYRYSSTEVFMVCRRRFNYEYVLEIEPDYAGSAPVSLADVGSAFHAGAEALYKGKANPERRMEAYIRLHKMQHALVKVGTKELFAGDVARGCFTRFKRWPGRAEFDGGRTPVLIEQKLRIEIIPGVWLTGIPDRVDEDEYGQLHIIDYKTVGRYDGFDSYSDRGRQGLTYSVLVEELLKKPVVGFTFLQVHRSPPVANPQPANPLTEPFTNDQKASHRKHLENVAREMVALAQGKLPVYPHPGGHCAWCPYKNLCYEADATPDGFDAMLNSQFRKKTQ